MNTGSGDFPFDTRPFLRQSTGPEPRSHRSKHGPEASLSATRWAYADKIPTSEAAEAVARALEGWDRYCTLALCIDRAQTGETLESIDRVVMDLIREAEECIGAVGCHWKELLYFIALPGARSEPAHEFAKQIQTKLASQRPETVSIGIAPFPLLAYDRRQSWANTCKALAHAAFLGPGSIVEVDAVSLNISADQHFQKGSTDDAIAEYRCALALDPNDTNVLNSLGVCLAAVNDIAAAKHNFKTVTEIEPLEPMARYNLGMLHLLEHRPEKALIHFQQAQASNHEFFEIPLQIGKLLSEQCRWEEALDYADKALALSQRPSADRVALTSGHRPGSQKHVSALNVADRRVVTGCKAPGLKTTHQGRGAIYGLKGLCLSAMEKTPEAIAAYSRSVKINPNNAEALSALGCLYDAKDENPDICRTFLEQSVALAPNNGLFHYRLGRWHQKHRQFGEARAAYRNAMAKGHDTTRQMAALGEDLNTEDVQTSLKTG